jgi:hypothetical protein
LIASQSRVEHLEESGDHMFFWEFVSEESYQIIPFISEKSYQNIPFISEKSYQSIPLASEESHQIPFSNIFTPQNGRNMEKTNYRQLRGFSLNKLYFVSLNFCDNSSISISNRTLISGSYINICTLDSIGEPHLYTYTFFLLFVCRYLTLSRGDRLTGNYKVKFTQ